MAAHNRPIPPHPTTSGRIVGRSENMFNISGNKYRLIARVNYRTQKVFILQIMTHHEYSKGDWK